MRERLPGRASVTPEPMGLAAPVAYRVRAVTDGDTFRIVTPWCPFKGLGFSIRIRGINTPEKLGACDLERALALQATAALRTLLDRSREGVYLWRVRHDKYGGRLLADVTLARDGSDLATLMIASGYARPYSGGRRSSWCDAATARRFGRSVS